jgi:hypothetical protein
MYSLKNKLKQLVTNKNYLKLNRTVVMNRLLRRITFIVR